MRPTIRVKPREGLQVRGPDGAVLPPEGAEVERSSWWIRRERDGDVIICHAETSKSSKTKEKEA